MSTRIFAAEGVRNFFNRWQGAISNPSTVVNKAISRYNYLLLQSVPNFSIEEWGIIFDLMAERGEVPLEHIPMLGNSIVNELYMSEELLAKWEIDIEAFAGKLVKLTQVETMAVIDIAERYLTTNVFENIGLPFKSAVIQ